MEWFSIEVVDGPFAASAWREAYGDALIETAVAGGALDWEWRTTPWGIVFEIAFADDPAWERFRAETIVQAALDAVPDPVGGLMIYRGRGGSAGNALPRRPRPLAGAGAAAIDPPLPEEDVEAIGRPLAASGAGVFTELVPAATGRTASQSAVRWRGSPHLARAAAGLGFLRDAAGTASPETSFKSVVF